MVSNDVVRISTACDNVPWNDVQYENLAREVVPQPGKGNVQVFHEALKVVAVNNCWLSQVNSLLSVMVINLDLLLMEEIVSQVGYNHHI